MDSGPRDVRLIIREPIPGVPVDQYRVVFDGIVAPVVDDAGRIQIRPPDHVQLVAGHRYEYIIDTGRGHPVDQTDQ